MLHGLSASGPTMMVLVGLSYDGTTGDVEIEVMG